MLAPPSRLPVCGCGDGPSRGQDRGKGNACRIGRVPGPVWADLPGPAGGRDDGGKRSAQVSSLGLARNAVEDQTWSLLRSLLSLLRPWRARVALVAVSVLAAAAVELVPPLVIRTIVDAHLTVQRPDGLLFLAFLYLTAAAAVQVMTFLYNYLAATIAQGVLSALRVRLFAHVQRLPTSYFDRVPMGDVISRCTADVETLDTVFSSNVALLLANLVRLATI
ncbi:MAG: ABC transporter ATP-binding protein, partial [Chloroflexi bacterium]